MSYYYLAKSDPFHYCEWELVWKFFQSKKEGMGWLKHMKKILVEDYYMCGHDIAFRFAENETTQERRCRQGSAFYYKKKLNY